MTETTTTETMVGLNDETVAAVAAHNTSTWSNHSLVRVLISQIKGYDMAVAEVNAAVVDLLVKERNERQQRFEGSVGTQAVQYTLKYPVRAAMLLTGLMNAAA